MAVRRRPARRAPGQHFLRSSRLAAELVRAAGVEPGDLVVEIGAGTGIITRVLAEAGARVLALEIDPALAAALRQRFRAHSDVTVLEADALTWRWPQEGFSVVANPPFAGSGPLLSRLLGDARLPLRRADVILQWEVAAKLAALWPATLKGSHWNAWYELAVTARLARSAFSPAPTVNAGVLRATRRARPLVDERDCDPYRAFLERAFRSRLPLQRALRPQLSAREVRRLASVLGFGPHARARDLDPGQWARVFALTRRRPG